jgi:hypothetical protein
VSVVPYGDQIIPSGTVTVINLGYELYDTANAHSPAQPARLLAPVPGIYLVTARIDWEITGGTYRFVAVRKNGGVPFAFNLGPPISPLITSQNVMAQLPMAAGDFIEVVVEQDSGDPELLLGASAQMTWIAGAP